MYIANMSNSQGILNYQNFVFWCSMVDNNPSKLIETYDYISTNINSRQLKRYLKKTKINKTLYMMFVCNYATPKQINYILENINKENLSSICFSISYIDRYVHKRKFFNILLDIILTKEEKDLLHYYIHKHKPQLIEMTLHHIYRINDYIDDIITYCRKFFISQLYYINYREINNNINLLSRFANELIENEDYILILCDNNLLTKELIDKIYFTDSFHVLVKYARQHRSYIDSLMMVNKLGGVE